LYIYSQFSLLSMISKAKELKNFSKNETSV
jgi:hypothetical protein